MANRCAVSLQVRRHGPACAAMQAEEVSMGARRATRFMVGLGLWLAVLAMHSVAVADEPVSFRWGMAERFGAKNDRGVPEFHWDARKIAYRDEYVHPRSWTVNFDACGSKGEAWAWEINGKPQPPRAECRFAWDFDRPGKHTVGLMVTKRGAQPVVVRREIELRDWLIVSIGDSYASGEGTPDVPQQYDALHLSVKSGPKWVDRRCHRSGHAGPAQMARQLARTLQGSVTFLSFACSGATIPQGLIGKYKGKEVPEGAPPLLASQIEQVATAVKGRTIDALLISIGGNDIGFADIAKRCTVNDAVPGNRSCSQLPALTNQLQQDLQKLPTLYAKVDNAIRSKLKVRRVFITEYPDPTYDEQGRTCGQQGRKLLYVIDPQSAAWARNTVLAQLNRAVEAAAKAAQDRNWTYVRGIAAAFNGHGECADAGKRWFLSEEDARKTQGPILPKTAPRARDAFVSDGTLHPNVKGHRVYAERLAEAFQRQFAAELGPIGQKATADRRSP